MSVIPAWAFAVHRLDDMQLVGHALISPVVRYASVAYDAGNTLVRRHAAPDTWQRIAADISTARGRTVRKDSVVAGLLTAFDVAVVVCLVQVTQIEFAAPSDVVGALDGYLRSLGEKGPGQ